MNKNIFLVAIISFGFLSSVYGDTSSPLGGMALLEQDKKQIKSLEGKLAEFEKSGGDASVIQAYIDLAKEMMELNNERHALHEATKSFEGAVGIFSKKIEAIIQKVNEILANQADAAVKNSQAIALLQPKVAGSKEEKNESNTNTEDSGGE